MVPVARRLVRRRPVSVRRTFRRATGVRRRRRWRRQGGRLLVVRLLRQRWRHQVWREPEPVDGRRGRHVLLVQIRLVLLVLLVLLLLVSRGRCGHGGRAATAGRGQLLVQAGLALHRGPLVPQMLAAGRGGRVVYAAQRAVRTAHSSRGRGRAQEQLRPGREHGPFLGRQLAQTAGRVQQRRPEHVVFAQHRLHRFPATNTSGARPTVSLGCAFTGGGGLIMGVNVSGGNSLVSRCPQGRKTVKLNFRAVRP